MAEHGLDRLGRKLSQEAGLPVVLTSRGEGAVTRLLQRDVGHEPHLIADRGTELTEGTNGRLAFLGWPGPADCHGDHGVTGRVERRRGSGAQLVGRRNGQLVVAAQGRLRDVGRVGDSSGQHRRHWMQAVGERDDDAEVASASAHGPEQIFVLLSRRGAQLSVSGDDVHGEQVVAGQAVVPVEPAEAAAECQAGDAGHRDRTRGWSPARVLLWLRRTARGSVLVPPRQFAEPDRPRSASWPPCRGSDRHWRWRSCDRVTAAFDRHREAVLAERTRCRGRRPSCPRSARLRPGSGRSSH